MTSDDNESEPSQEDRPSLDGELVTNAEKPEEGRTLSETKEDDPV